MKILIHIGCVTKNAIFMQFYIIVPETLSFIQPAFAVIKEMIGNFLVVSNND